MFMLYVSCSKFVIGSLANCSAVPYFSLLEFHFCLNYSCFNQCVSVFYLQLLLFDCFVLFCCFICWQMIVMNELYLFHYIHNISDFVQIVYVEV